MDSSPPAQPVRVFISYRHADYRVLNDLRDHLGWLESSEQIKVFDDREILAGDDWDARIRTELEQAEIILLVITAKFMRSPYCTKVELKSAIERRANEGTRIIPIIAEACDWEAMPIFKFAALPKDKANNLNPLNKWRGNKDVALTQIARHVRMILGETASKHITIPQEEYREDRPNILNPPTNLHTQNVKNIFTTLNNTRRQYRTLFLIIASGLFILFGSLVVRSFYPHIDKEKEQLLKQIRTACANFRQGEFGNPYRKELDKLLLKFEQSDYTRPVDLKDDPICYG